MALIVLSPCVNAKITYKRTGNIIYSSLYDNSMFIIAANNNGTIARFCTYDIYFICYTQKNFTIRYNETPIGFKNESVKIMQIRYFANDSQFSINVIETNNNRSKVYIDIHYMAAGDIIILPDNTPILPDEIPAELKFLGYTVSEAWSIIGWIALISMIIITLMGFSIKRFKEHRTVEKHKKIGLSYFRGE